MSGEVVGGWIVPGRPHVLLQPEANPGWTVLRDAYAQVRRDLEALNPDLVLLYSTQWVSIIGHQFQADPEPDWHLVDHDFHQLGTMHYKMRMDAAFAASYEAKAKARGLTARTVAYRGFPIDTGSIVALSLLNPDNRFPAGIVSCNMSGKRVALVAVTALSNRMWTEWIEPKDDRIHSLKDDEWNRKLLELLAEGRLEDVSQLARLFSQQAHADSKLKAIWWLASCMGQHNNYRGQVYAYEPVWGTGAALVGLTPDAEVTGGLEYDEDDVEVYRGDRNVLTSVQDDESSD
jgi:2-aminophenol/2-amino-5-chlorophenol 1,6-dioxygenase alpha subunit